MFYIKISCIIVLLTNFTSVIFWYFLAQFLKLSNNSLCFDIQYLSTPIFEVTQLPLHKEAKTKQRINIMGQPIVANLNLKSDVDRPASGKLGQSTTVPSQCDQLS